MGWEARSVLSVDELYMTRVNILDLCVYAGKTHVQGQPGDTHPVGACRTGFEEAEWK